MQGELRNSVNIGGGVEKIKVGSHRVKKLTGIGFVIYSQSERLTVCSSTKTHPVGIFFKKFTD